MTQLLETEPCLEGKDSIVIVVFIIRDWASRSRTYSSKRLLGVQAWSAGTLLFLVGLLFIYLFIISIIILH